MYFQKSHFLSPGGQVIDGFLNAAGSRAHYHDHMLRVIRSVVVEGLVVSSGEGVHLLHIFIYNVREGIVIGIAGLTALEICIGILAGGPKDRVLGIQGVLPEFLQLAVIHQLRQVVVIQAVHFLNLVRGPETVKEMEERNMSLDSGQMSNGSQVHGLLHVSRGQKGESGLAAGHDIGLFRVNGDGVGSYVSGSYMNHAGFQLSRNPVHGGNHQH